MHGQEDWCSQLRPTKAITELAIPGTHDSAAWTHHENVPGTPATWAQRKSITEQLELGVRALDMRVGWRLGWTGSYGVGMYHGIIDLSISLEDVLGEVDTWLGAHGQELVILIFQQQGKKKGDPGTPWDVSAEVKKLVDAKLGDKLFRFRSSLTAWPTVQDLRGKVLALGRLPSNPEYFCDVRNWLQYDAPEGVSFKTGNGLDVYLQDRYKGLSSAQVEQDVMTKGDYERKLSLVEKACEVACWNGETLLEDRKALTINHLSHSSIKWQPWTIGKVMNTMLRQSKFTIRGLLMIDDADADTVNHIVKWNASGA